METEPRVPEPRVSERVDEWVRAGLISREQAAAIQVHETGRWAPPVPVVAPSGSGGRRDALRWPSAAEALGYLGGLLAVIGLVLAVVQAWDALAAAGRIGLVSGVAVALTVGGVMVRPETVPALARLRWTLWTLGSAAGAVLGSLVVVDVLDVDRPRTVVLGGAVVVAVHGAATWRNRPRPVQMMIAVSGAIVAIGAAVSHAVDVGPTGVVVWVLGGVALALGVGRVTALPALMGFLGAAGLVAGGVMMSAVWAGTGVLVLLVTAVLLLLVVLVPGITSDAGMQTAVGVVALVAALQSFPPALGYYAEQAGIVTGVLVWVGGLGALASGLTRRVRIPDLVAAGGGAVMLTGAAVTGVQSVAVAVVAGLVTASGVLWLGAAPDRLLCSLVGSLGLVANVPWAIVHFFPGEGRVPLLIMVTGLVIVALAVGLTRRHGPHGRRPSSGPAPHHGGHLPHLR